jgi:hypothetical protein
MTDITMSLDDTLELDTIIRESSVPLNPVTDVKYEGSDSTVHNSTGLQTNTYIFEPEKSGNYTITVNGQELTIKVTDPSTIPDSGIFRYTWDSKNIVNGVLNDVWGDHNLSLSGEITTGEAGLSTEYNSEESALFDGSNDEGRYSYTRNSISEWSITFWINSKSGSNNKILADDDDGNSNPVDCFEAQHDNGVIELYSGGGSWISFDSLSTDTPTFVGITVDETDTTVQVGTSKTTNSYSQSLFNQNTLVVGRGQSGFESYFSGHLDDIRGYSKKLSTTELDNLRMTGKIKG